MSWWCPFKRDKDRLESEKDLYSREDVEYVIRAILRETVTRENLLKVFEKLKIRDIIGNDLANKIFEEINNFDFDSDLSDLDKWFSFLDNK